MAGYVDANLAPDERVTYRGQVSWVVYLAPVVVSAFGLAWAAGGGERTGMIMLLVGVIGVAGAFIRQSSSEFAVTTDRVIVKTGFLSRKTIEIKLSKVESVQVDQDITGRLFNFGTMTVVGTGGTKEPFSLIDDPMGFRRAVQAEQG